VRILATDNSGRFGSVAFVDGDAAVEAVYGPELRHAETLLPEVEKLLGSVSVAPGALDLLAIGIGPGSFTGLRVGLATIKGLALATGVPIVGVSSLAAIAHDCDGSLVAVVNDGQRGEVFASIFERADGELRERVGPMHGSPSELGRVVRSAIGPASIVCTGDGLELAGRAFLASLGEPQSTFSSYFPRASAVAVLAARALRERGPDDVRALEPHYVRGADAKLPARRLGSFSPGSS
jgi:tRNA threonylcarbamoyladenosine biosynthesis protein TsaB